jgi:hypothetical protein
MRQARRLLKSEGRFECRERVTVTPLRQAETPLRQLRAQTSHVSALSGWRGRDATHVAISTSFGPCQLTGVTWRPPRCARSAGRTPGKVNTRRSYRRYRRLQSGSGRLGSTVSFPQFGQDGLSWSPKLCGFRCWFCISLSLRAAAARRRLFVQYGPLPSTIALARVRPAARIAIKKFAEFVRRGSRLNIRFRYPSDTQNPI